jgi:AraC-like DNA-binding protein
MMRLVDNYKMAAAFARSLGDYCLSLDVDMKTLARQVGINPNDFNDTTKFVSLEKFTSLLELLAIQTCDDCFGIKFGSYFKLGDSGPFGFGLLNAVNFGVCLQFFSRFISLTGDYTYFSYEAGPPNAVVRWRYSPLLSAHYQYADMMATISIRQFRMSCGPGWVPSQVSLVRSMPIDCSIHQAFMGSNVEFTSIENRIMMPSQCLQNQNPGADKRLFELMLTQCDEALIKRMKSLPLEIKLRNLIVNRLGSETVSLPEIANALDMSARNLQRCLKLKNTSFESVLDESRRELTESLFKHSELSIADVSERVGYSATSAFSRAVKKWYGLSPGVAREKIIAGKQTVVRAL